MTKPYISELNWGSDSSDDESSTFDEINANMTKNSIRNIGLTSSSPCKNPKEFNPRMIKGFID